MPFEIDDRSKLQTIKQKEINIVPSYSMFCFRTFCVFDECILVHVSQSIW